VSRSLGILSLKGGVGKTLIAVHLAHYLHEQGEVVVLVDSEASHGSRKWHLRGKLFPFDVVMVEDYRAQEWRGVWQVFDTPAHPSAEFQEALAEVLDLAIIPVTPNVDAQAAAIELAPYFRQFMPVRTVLTNMPDRSRPDAQLVYAYMRTLELSPYRTILYARKAYEYARLEGVPVSACSQRSRMAAWLEFERLGKEIVADAIRSREEGRRTLDYAATTA
jgi:chromosome partitioning protein